MTANRSTIARSTEMFMNLLLNRPILNTEMDSDLAAKALKSSARINVANATVLAPFKISASPEASKKMPPFVRSAVINAVATVTKIAIA